MAAIARKSAQARSLWRRLKPHQNDRIFHSGQARPSPFRTVRSPLVTPSSFSELASNLIRRRSRIRTVAVYLQSLMPMHSATAAACLVSKLPSEASPSLEGRFSNYLSPI